VPASSHLECTFCHSTLEYAELHPGYGILECRCDRWPVVDGIPIIQRTPIGHIEHTKGTARYRSTSYSELVDLIDAHEFSEALLRCLRSPRTLPGLQRLIGWTLSHSKIVVGLWQRLDNAALENLLARRDALTATDLFEFFCNPNTPLGDGAREYFTYRFGMPRHLSALALIESIPSSTQPVLDIACGAGHIEHYLERRSDPTAVIGCDFNFFQLWVAQHWIAPLSSFVCADVRDGLPFADEVFSAVICSDAYHCIENRRLLLSEIERCAPRRPLILTRAGNRSVRPNEGYENDIDGYLDEVPGAQVFHDAGLVHDYLERQAPQPSSVAEARKHKWVSFVRNAAPTRAPSAEWPHAVGQLVLNPVYRVLAQTDGARHLRYHSPSEWFEFENGEMLQYLPRELTVTREELQPPGEALIRQTVVVGVPDRYNADSVAASSDHAHAQKACPPVPNLSASRASISVHAER
jgi:SAM-dependent methyltransferase